MNLSIIVPCLNEEKFIAESLEHLQSLEGNPEIILVDGGSTDSTLDLARNFPGVRIISSEKGRAVQMNTGAKKATGEVLLFLHADTFLPQNAHEAVMEHLRDKKMIGGSFFLEFDHAHVLLQFYSWCSKLSLEFFTYGDHAIFVKKKVFEKIGGYRNIPFMEDVEIQSRLRREGKFRKLKCGVTTSARRFRKMGTLKQFCLDVLLVGLFKLGTSPSRLKAFYKDHS